MESFEGLSVGDKLVVSSNTEDMVGRIGPAIRQLFVVGVVHEVTKVHTSLNGVFICTDRLRTLSGGLGPTIPPDFAQYFEIQPKEKHHQFKKVDFFKINKDIVGG